MALTLPLIFEPDVLPAFDRRRALAVQQQRCLPLVGEEEAVALEGQHGIDLLLHAHGEWVDGQHARRAGQHERDGEDGSNGETGRAFQK